MIKGLKQVTLAILFLTHSLDRPLFGWGFGLSPSSPDLWLDGVIPYEIDSNFENPKMILEAMREWEAKTRIRFRRRTANDKDYLRIKNQIANGAGGGASTVGRGTGESWISLLSGEPYYSYLHELGHAIGLKHEHQRPDRDNFVEFRKENIASSFQKFAYAYDKLTNFQTYGPYDSSSIMHYNSSALVLKQSGSGFPGHMISDGDIATVNAMYASSRSGQSSSGYSMGTGYSASHGTTLKPKARYDSPSDTASKSSQPSSNLTRRVDALETAMVVFGHAGIPIENRVANLERYLNRFFSKVGGALPAASSLEQKITNMEFLMQRLQNTQQWIQFQRSIQNY